MALPVLKGGGVYGFWGVGSAGAPQVSVVVTASVGLLGGAESWRSRGGWWLELECIPRRNRLLRYRSEACN